MQPMASASLTGWRVTGAAVMALASPWLAGQALGAEGSAEATRVLSMLKSHASDSDPTYGADSYLLTLTDSQQLEVARRLSAD